MVSISYLRRQARRANLGLQTLELVIDLGTARQPFQLVLHVVAAASRLERSDVDQRVEGFGSRLQPIGLLLSPPDRHPELRQLARHAGQCFFDLDLGLCRAVARGHDVSVRAELLDANLQRALLAGQALLLGAYLCDLRRESFEL